MLAIIGAPCMVAGVSGTTLHHKLPQISRRAQPHGRSNAANARSCRSAPRPPLCALLHNAAVFEGAKPAAVSKHSTSEGSGDCWWNGVRSWLLPSAALLVLWNTDGIGLFTAGYLLARYVLPLGAIFAVSRHITEWHQTLGLTLGFLSLHSYLNFWPRLWDTTPLARAHFIYPFGQWDLELPSHVLQWIVDHRLLGDHLAALAVLAAGALALSGIINTLYTSAAALLQRAPALPAPTSALPASQDFVRVTARPGERPKAASSEQAQAREALQHAATRFQRALLRAQQEAKQQAAEMESLRESKFELQMEVAALRHHLQAHGSPLVPAVSAHSAALSQHPAALPSYQRAILAAVTQKMFSGQNSSWQQPSLQAQPQPTPTSHRPPPGRYFTPIPRTGQYGVEGRPSDRSSTAVRQLQEELRRLKRHAEAGQRELMSLRRQCSEQAARLDAMQRALNQARTQLEQARAARQISWALGGRNGGERVEELQTLQVAQLSSKAW